MFNFRNGLECIFAVLTCSCQMLFLVMDWLYKLSTVLFISTSVVRCGIMYVGVVYDGNVVKVSRVFFSDFVYTSAYTCTLTLFRDTQFQYARTFVVVRYYHVSNVYY